MNRQFVLTSWAALILAFGCSHHTAPSMATPAKSTATPSTTTRETTPDEKPTTKDGVTLVKAGACRGVKDHEPLGTGVSFPPNVGRLYLFSDLRLNDGVSNSSIQHIWHFNNQVMAKVTLPIRGQKWRTYSSKSIRSNWVGDWKVDITTTKGELLKSVAFRVEKQR